MCAGSFFAGKTHNELLCIQVVLEEKNGGKHTVTTVMARQPHKERTNMQDCSVHRTKDGTEEMAEKPREKKTRNDDYTVRQQQTKPEKKHKTAADCE